MPDGFTGVSVSSACSRVSGMLSVGLSDSAGADGLAGISLFGSAADVTSAEASTEDGLSVIVSGGSCLPHPAKLRSIRPARRSAYRFIFFILITSDYKDTGKRPKVQRESAVLKKVTFSAQKPGLHLPPDLPSPAVHLPPFEAAVHRLPKPRH